MKPFKDIITAIGHMFNKEHHREEQLLSGLDIDVDRLYEDPSAVVEVQNRYAENLRRIDRIKPKYKKYVNHVATLERLEMLPGKSKSNLEKMCQVYSETLIQKSDFKNQIQGVDVSNSEYLEKYEHNLDAIVGMMREHEENQQLVKQDLAYLESEKSELSYYLERYGKAYGFIRNALIIVASFAALSALVLSTMFFIYQMDILIPGMVAMLAVIAGTVWVYVFRRYLAYELNKNQKLMKRAVELTNKTKIKYINNQKLLDYQYRKYKVDCSEMLALRWENYRNNIAAKKQYRNISNSIAAMISDIEDLLEDNGIDDDGLVLDHIDYFTSAQGRKILMTKLVERRNELKQEYEQTEKENDVINLVLTNYKSSGIGSR